MRGPVTSAIQDSCAWLAFEGGICRRQKKNHQVKTRHVKNGAFFYFTQLLSAMCQINYGGPFN